ncbi:MAG: T9SS type A sorting domain-containing protein [Calditrichaeota bacterium]|nr:T9SS type A sorting domain-containing protein [Candidatus Cloacimonadota bacterium]MCA9785180.1 T9SS type A sorting domain-containing protein [Candidatus Cloacimonadota bacterium]MCB1045816.1 T9SS type A sorting domain-containing protein [Calditrichota bacterium]MCB9473841.1 T9SS type A sorting domain-containing protein [Candidatus Delongbacteria bacterium]
MKNWILLLCLTWLAAPAFSQCLEITPPESPEAVLVNPEFPLTYKMYFDFVNTGEDAQAVDLDFERVSGGDAWTVSLCRNVTLCYPLWQLNNFHVVYTDTIAGGDLDFYDVQVVTNTPAFDTGVYDLSILPQNCPENGVDLTVTITITDQVSVDVQPRQFFLSQNYPNPFNPTTRIPFELRSDARISLDVYDITGQLVASPVRDAGYSAGLHEVSFDGSSLQSGLYFYRFSTPWGSRDGKMVLAR